MQGSQAVCKVAYLEALDERGGLELEPDPRLLMEKSGKMFRVGISLNSPAHLRVGPVGRTRRWAGEIELAPIGVELNGSRRVPGPACTDYSLEKEKER